MQALPLQQSYITMGGHKKVATRRRWFQARKKSVRTLKASNLVKTEAPRSNETKPRRAICTILMGVVLTPLLIVAALVCCDCDGCVIAAMDASRRISDEEMTK
eukprot:symbB.v1.2.034231.t1/scaffold4386.1/size40349/1